MSRKNKKKNLPRIIFCLAGDCTPRERGQGSGSGWCNICEVDLYDNKRDNWQAHHHVFVRRQEAEPRVYRMTCQSLKCLMEMLKFEPANKLGKQKKKKERTNPTKSYRESQIEEERIKHKAVSKQRRDEIEYIRDYTKRWGRPPYPHS